MEEIVIDSSVAVKRYIVEEYSEIARRIFSDYEQGRLNFHAPDLIYAEVGNIVWKKHLFQNLSEADAQAALTLFQQVPLDITPSADLIDDAYRLAVTYRRSVYDSLYIALSLRAGCRFVTADERLVNAVSEALPNVIWLPNWV